MQDILHIPGDNCRQSRDEDIQVMYLFMRKLLLNYEYKHVLVLFVK